MFSLRAEHERGILCNTDMKRFEERKVFQKTEPLDSGFGWSG